VLVASYKKKAACLLCPLSHPQMRPYFFREDDVSPGLRQPFLLADQFVVSSANGATSTQPGATPNGVKLSLMGRQGAKTPR